MVETETKEVRHDHEGTDHARGGAPDRASARAAARQGRRSSRCPPQSESVLRRLALAFVGFGIAMLGFSLMLTVFLVFIGLPLFIVGVAIMQAQES